MLLNRALRALVPSTDREFWEKRYRTHRTPWDHGAIPAALHRFLSGSPAAGSVLIPGCGSGYEVKAFADAGWRVTAIDYSPAAIERARRVLGPLASAARVADFFTDNFGGAFDLIYERTFLCSMPPDRWPVYVQRMAALLPPPGRLAGPFVYGGEPGGPPFPLSSLTAATTLFAPGFALTTDLPIPPAESLPLFAGRERWQVWQR